ncbi:MAG: antibiotic biosynthesis monooxygenase [Armatimonadetes bacterium]|nr:antibiotic biosynthesis monooxygenase [Armatimonadota bacterium]MDW8122058.1 antibiotic biosynthesis monooxygenase [Armatimonadota bacterium]
MKRCSKMVAVFFTVRVRDQGRERFLEGLRKRARLVDKRKGFEKIDVLQDQKDPNRFVVLTWWADYQDFVAWQQSDEFAIAHSRSSELMAETNLEVFNVVLSEPVTEQPAD